MYQSRDPTVCINQQESGEEINTQQRAEHFSICFLSQPHIKIACFFIEESWTTTSFHLLCAFYSSNLSNHI